MEGFKDLEEAKEFIEKERIKSACVERIYISISKGAPVSVEYRYLKKLKQGSIYTTITNPKATIDELYEKTEK